MPLEFGGLASQTLALVGGATVASGVGGYLVHTAVRRRRRTDEPMDLARLREATASTQNLAVVVPENPTIDAIAAAVGVRALCKEWGVPSRIYTEGGPISDDAKAFCNLLDLALADLDDAIDTPDSAVVVGGGGPVPSFGNQPVVVAVVRHRPTVSDDHVVVSGDDDGATSTVVARVLEDAGVTPEPDVATALQHGIRAGTHEFRRVRGSVDYDAASYLHEYADVGRLDALRTPGMSSETFDVLGSAIANRERRASFAVTNVGTVPSVSSLEEAANTLLRLDGVSSAAAFGLHDDTVVVTCRADDVRLSARDVLANAFDHTETLGGDADAAIIRIPLGLFSRLDDAHQDTLDDLVDASTRRTLFAAFEHA